MVFYPASTTSLVIFTIFSICMGLLFILGFKKTSQFKILMFSFTIYLILYTLIVSSGFLKNHPFPFIPILFLCVLAPCMYLGLSKYGLEIADQVSIKWLILLQGFRLPLELILHHWAMSRTIPETMTWSGQNFDIVTGIISILGFPFVERYKKLAWTIQMISFLLFLNVLRVVILSSPFPFSWKLEIPLQLILYLPYAYIGPLFVGFALMIHLITFRKLMRK